MSYIDKKRAFYAALVTANGATQSEPIKSAFASVDRGRFLGPGPWKVMTALGYIETPDDDPSFLYNDVVVALRADRSINNGEPSLHARCLAAVAPQPGERVLHVGAGTGYYTAILAQLVGPSGSVAAYEIDPDLAKQAQQNVADLPQVSVHARSAIEPGLPASDVIYVCAGATHPPEPWLSALKLHGRLIFPLSGTPGLGVMLMVTRVAENSYAARIVSPAMFIPCIGASESAEAEAVTAALMKGGHREVRSLVRSDQPDESAWLSGKGWWLSRASI